MVKVGAATVGGGSGATAGVIGVGDGAGDGVGGNGMGGARPIPPPFTINARALGLIRFVFKAMAMEFSSAISESC
jgi:hypothetical protein